MPSPNDPNADDGKPFVAPSSTQKQEAPHGHEVTDAETPPAGAERARNTGSAGRDGER